MGLPIPGAHDGTFRSQTRGTVTALSLFSKVHQEFPE